VQSSKEGAEGAALKIYILMLPALLPLWSSDRKIPLNLMSLSFCVMGTRSRPASILQKAIIIFR
jgi:hypothetical protein